MVFPFSGYLITEEIKRLTMAFFLATCEKGSIAVLRKRRVQII